MRAFVSVHFGLDRVHLGDSHASSSSTHRSLASLLVVVLLACLGTLNNTLVRLARLVRPRRRRRSNARLGPRLPHDLVPHILLDWSASSSDPVDVYLERAQFYRACALVQSSWTALAQALLARDLAVRDPQHPVLRHDCPLDSSRVWRITFAPRPRFAGSAYGMTACLRLFTPQCHALTSLAILDADLIELADLGSASNLVELHVFRTRIGRSTSTPTPPFKLVHLRTLTLDEVGFTTFRPSYAALLDPVALPSLVTLSMRHCDLVWTVFPKPRTFVNVSTFRFTHPGAFPVTHLAQMRFPALEHLVLCPTALRDVLSRASSSPDEADAALALVAQATHLRLVDSVDSRAPPASPTFPLPRLTTQHGLVLPSPCTGSRTVSVPLPERVLGPAAAAHRLSATVQWTWAEPRRLAHAVRAHVALVELLNGALVARELLSHERDGATLELPSALRYGLPGADARGAKLWSGARARLDRLCRDRGVELAFTEVVVEEVDKAREVWGGWAGCAER
ncbi:uncharacterized protein RHOBADRAFT_43503 [Rhodotorula graminis WP1]|uniref:Uncharacterized protein n=1 Tax=Rhodotorula graminis (strain WP1) TaxID=578459 RepID=A0A194S693_RHOGW|nr:uncharacterized protein RHOBADRAFT_43503 [Rhodotorula graminis WP1]KPV76064.1 hypothetical protein RHOBADRAFT_43503 [Rhodotorula graminis WP1]